MSTQRKPTMNEREQKRCSHVEATGLTSGGRLCLRCGAVQQPDGTWIEGRPWSEVKQELGIVSPQPATAAEVQAGEWRFDCPCDFRHPQSRAALPGRYHEEGCFKRVSPQVEAYMVSLEGEVRTLRERAEAAERAHDTDHKAWVRANNTAVRLRERAEIAESTVASLREDVRRLKEALRELIRRYGHMIEVDSEVYDALTQPASVDYDRPREDVRRLEEALRGARDALNYDPRTETILRVVRDIDAMFTARALTHPASTEQDT